MKIDSFNIEGRISYTVVDNGDDFVFLHSDRWGRSDEVADNEYYASIRFPVAKGQTSFSYTDAQLWEHRCYYSGTNAGIGYGQERLDNGTISGTRNDDGTWEITIDVTLKNVEQQLKTSHIKRKATFVEGEWF